MKILIYHPNMHLLGGGETVCLNIAAVLKKDKKNEVIILTQKNQNTKGKTLIKKYTWANAAKTIERVLSK